MHSFVNTVLTDAVGDLRRGLSVYWPARGNSEMAEAHALGAIGRALGRADFHVFHEVSCPSEGSAGHIDLVAISVERSICLAVEGKRLHRSDGCGEIVRDWQRLGLRHLASEYGKPKLKHHVRMVVATTWQSKIKDWWDGGLELPAGARHESWSTLRQELAGANVNALHVQTDRSWGEQWLLVASAERPTPFFA